MTKNTEKAGPLPNASIDFNKVHANAKAGKADVFDGACSHQREETVSKEERKVLDAAAEVRAEEAGRELAPDNTLVDAADAAEEDAATSSKRAKRSSK